MSSHFPRFYILSNCDFLVYRGSFQGFLSKPQKEVLLTFYFNIRYPLKVQQFIGISNNKDLNYVTQY